MNKKEQIEEEYKFDNITEDQVEILKNLLASGSTVYISYKGQTDGRKFIQFTTNKTLISTVMYKMEDNVQLKASLAKKSIPLDFQKDIDRKLAQQKKGNVTGVDLATNPPSWKTLNLSKVTGFQEK